ncbi:MAG: hypothetical protein U0234_04355 [Sandaracinus sp.]
MTSARGRAGGQVRAGLLAAAALGVLAVVAPARAQSLDPEEIPPALRPWVPWVLAEDATYGCTAVGSAAGADVAGDPICVWPTSLRIEVGPSGASFALELTSDREHAVELPGAGREWPTDVRIDGHATPVLATAGVPVVFVDAGAHRVEGRIVWTEAPERLQVPAGVARVLVVENGRTRVGARDTDGAVWLEGDRSAAVTEPETPVEEQADTVRIEAYRRVADGMPLDLATRLSLHVSGRPRELALGRVLPDGALPVGVDADLPVRMSAEGELTLQIHAGTFSVEIRAVVPHPDGALVRPASSDPWPEQEVWTWAPSESFRQVEVGGASSIDPARTTLPEDWRSSAAFLVEQGGTMTLTTVRRGEPTPPPNVLLLSRTIWLDEDGGGASIADSLSLDLHQGFRVELEEGELGRVSVAGQDQLITAATEGGRPGVELRDTHAEVTAEWRALQALSELPAVGWSEDAQHVSTTLELPPGWTLLHASGVDGAPLSWSDRWTLLGFFALLLVSVVVGRVYGPIWGVAAFVGLGLAYPDDEAPTWIWVVLAALLALHRALGARSFARWARHAYLAAMVFAAVFSVIYAAHQARIALHPALDPVGASAWYPEEEPSWQTDDLEGGTGRRHAEEGMMGDAAAAVTSSRYGIEGPSDQPDPHMARELATSTYAWMDPSSVVQTGFGCPTWQWRSYDLVLDGPVGREHRIGLWLSPPWLTTIVGLLRAGLLLALVWAVVRARPKGEGAPPASAPAPAPAPASVAAAALVALLAAPTMARAQATAPPGPIPPPEVLAQLHERLLWTAECGDTCAEATAMRIDAHGDVLAIEIDVGATVRAAYPLPGPVDTWSPDTVTIDGQPARALVRLASGFVHVRLEPGAHTVRAQGTLAGRSALTLALGRAPRTIAITTAGWETDGSGTGPTVAESIQLRRSLDAAPTTPDATEASPDAADQDASERVVLPSWLTLERRFDVGVRWTIASTLRRHAGGGTAEVVRIPLLPGESITDASIVVEGGVAVVTLPQLGDAVSWTSVLAPAPELVLHAPEDERRSERWTIACTPLWHCTPSGLAPTLDGGSSESAPRFDPWPGETLTVAMSRPDALPGPSTTVDSAVLTVEPGARLTSSNLRLDVRTSVSAPLAITLPAEAEIRSLEVDGTARPVQQEDGAVTVALQPGAHSVTMAWQEASGWTALFGTPEVRLDRAAVNLSLEVSMSSDRWILWIAGPRWGPAVLLWPYLLVIVVVGYGLSRRRELLPTLADWILLGLGLSQVPAAVALVVVAWFFVVELRRVVALEGALFDLRQVFVAFYTLVAASALVGVVSDGLLGAPGMDVQGPMSDSSHLHFFVDRSDGALPSALVVTLPVFVYRVLMFLWAAWLALAVVRWARKGWGVFSEGALWMPLVGPRGPMRPAPPAAPPAAPAVPATEVAAPSEVAAPAEAAAPADVEPPSSAPAEPPSED